MRPGYPPRQSGLVMGFDAHMIAGSCACPCIHPARSPHHHQPDKPTLCRGPGLTPISSIASCHPCAGDCAGIGGRVRELSWLRPPGVSTPCGCWGACGIQAFSLARHGAPAMPGFDLAGYVRASVEVQDLPERLTDSDTILGVVRLLILAKRSGLLSDQTPTNGHPTHPATPNGGPAKTAESRPSQPAG